ncbi:MAG: pyruvate, water dikinase regulatory protein [Thiohalomonadales bacterium]
MKRSVFFISDRTGITAEMLGHGLLTQFSDINFHKTILPYIDNAKKAQQVVMQINQAALEDRCRPLIFSTLIDAPIRKIIATSNALLLDFFAPFIASLETELACKASTTMGRSHGMDVYANYKERIDAVNFALSTDDGLNHRNYPDADVILIGVSRSGKTPTSLYLALQYGLRVANYPITEEDWLKPGLSNILRKHKMKLFGLTISVQRLQQIRQERRSVGSYASLQQCKFEIKTVEKLYHDENIPYLDCSHVSIEEIATSIMQLSGLQRHLHG